MTSETPGQGANPGWGQPPAPGGDAPTEPIPPVPPAAAPWGQQPQTPAAPAAPAWGQPPAQPAPPPQQAPVAPAWTQPPQAPAQQPPAQLAPQWSQPPAEQQPGWGAPPPQQAPQQQPGWGAPPPQQQAPQQPGWNAPPPVAMQQPMYGGQQPGWNGGAQPPPKQGNGCLKACLIVAAIGIVIVIVIVILGIVGLGILGNKVKDTLNVGPNGQLTECPFVSNATLAGPLGKDTQATELSGIYDATIGQVLDKRVLATAQSCWLLQAGNTSTGTGRIARYQGSDAADRFATEHKNAVDGLYLADDASGVGDGAFCTGVSITGMSGALVRKGNTLVYVSLFDETYAAGQDPTTGSGGASYSQATCKLAEKVAAAVNP